MTKVTKMNKVVTKVNKVVTKVNRVTKVTKSEIDNNGDKVIIIKVNKVNNVKM